MKAKSKKMSFRLSTVAMTALISLTSLSSSVMVAPEELNDLARSNIRVVIDFLRWVGNNGEADNIQEWLDNGKINMDEDLGEDVGAETDQEGNITIRRLDIATVDLSGAPRIRLFSGISDLAAILVHEKVHAHQGPRHWVEITAFALSLANDFDEMVAYYREIDLREDWMNWLIEEYNNEVRTYNPKVEAFNGHAQAITEGQNPDKATMQELLSQIQQETRELIAKKQGIIYLAGEIPGRAKVLKKANYEKENYLYDRIREEWEQFRQGWVDNMSLLGTNRERGQDWAEWLEQDPPPLPGRLITLPERLPKNTDNIKTAYREAEARREAWERQTDSDKVQHLMPFLERVAATLPTDGRVNLRVYTDVTYRAYYNRVQQNLGIEVRNGTIASVVFSGYATSEQTVRVPESAILRILIADDLATAYDREVAAGHIRFEPEEPTLVGSRRNPPWWLPVLLGVLLLMALGALVVVWRKRR